MATLNNPYDNPYHSSQSITNQYGNLNQAYVGGYYGNPSQNLTELQQVQEELHKRHMVKSDRFGGRFSGVVTVPLIPGSDPKRIIQPLYPANEYIHPDNHIAWLRGRTLSVCRRSSWSKAT